MAEISGFSSLSDKIQPILRGGDDVAHQFRVGRANNMGLTVQRPSKHFYERDTVVDIFQNTQFDGEHHRLLTPMLMDEMDMGAMERVDRWTATRTPGGRSWDVIVVGGGIHAAAIVTYLREKNPLATTLVIDDRKRLGGQWRAYGDKPVFQMNSRVRRANRLLAPVPRTPGNINPMGEYAPMELSDVAGGNYAWNTEMGAVVAMNIALSATDMHVGENRRVGTVERAEVEVTSKVKLLDINYGHTARVLVDARGVQSKSAVERETGVRSDYSLAALNGRYFDTTTVYQHFASEDTPLELFHNRRVILLGAGDSACTVLEALLGNLSDYGRGGVGRYRPARIDWVGTPGNTQGSIEKCLRPRYKNGIVQALPKNSMEDMVIRPTRRKAASYRATGTGVSVRVGVDRDVLEGDVVIDCTNVSGLRPTDPFIPNDPPYSYVVGPYSAPLDEETKRRVEMLDIVENTASLWATMPRTYQVAREISSYLSS